MELNIADLSHLRWTIDTGTMYKARMLAGITQQEVADHCGWTSSYVSRLECGLQSRVSTETVKKLIDAFRSHGIKVSCEVPRSIRRLKLS